MKKEHVSYGMIDISRYSGGKGEFFGSDLCHNGGISIKISNAEAETKYSSNWYHPTNNLIAVRMSHNQFVDAITSGMNTSGVPCTVTAFNGESIPQISHITDKKDQFTNDMKDTHIKYHERINDILNMLDGKIGVKKAKDIKHELEVLKSHISSNTNFVMTCFNEAMEDTVTEAKHSIANYIDHKVHSLGIESMREELKISIEKE